MLWANEENMKTHDDKTQENKNQSAANPNSQRQSYGKSSIQFLDNRSVAVAQRILQETANNGPQTYQLSAFQEMANKRNALIQFNGKRTFSQAFGEDDTSEYEPPKKRRKLLGINRLHRAYLRNVKRKARPSNPRAVFSRQELHNYGYEHKVINFGSVKGDFYKGPFGDQPYLRINKEDYGLDSTPKTNYDEIIKGLNKFGDDATLARMIIDKIRHGIELPENLDSHIKTNVSLIIQLTQFIEPHESRVPGIDKLARSFLEQIAYRTMTFSQVFNRKNGSFVVANAKAVGAKYGGQESGRTLVGVTAKKSDKSTLDEIWTPRIDLAAEQMSDSSDDED